MIDRFNFKQFIDNTVAPNVKPKSTFEDMRVDPYGNFEVVFTHCNSSFGDSAAIYGYAPLGETLFKKETHLHKYIKSINDIEINVNSSPLEMPGISYAIHRLMPMNSTANLTFMWLNTKTPYVETVFVPWMQDNTINGKFPLVKADLEITFPLLSDPAIPIMYKYYGVRPLECTLHKMTNEPVTDFYRKVSFDFDYFYVFINGATKVY